MSKKLVIVESPGKIKKIQSILGSNFVVKASVGHLQDLDPHSLSVDVIEQSNGEYRFIPKYKVLDDKKKVVLGIKKIINDFDEVIIASDEDREGEFIGYSIASIFQLDRPKRIVFNEITERAIKYAIDNPITLNYDLIESQKTRRILDRLIGYKLHPLLGAGLSAGRVQSVVVSLIIQKDNDVKKDLESIKPQRIVEGNFDGFKAQLHNGILSDIKKELTYLFGISPYYISDVKVSQVSKNPPPPFTTSSFQQECYNVLKIVPKLAMQIAQKLYESGYITYMRTDSTVISKDFNYKILNVIKEKYGENYLNQRTYKNKTNSQEAHECIRPTDIKVEHVLDKFENRVYQLIWKRTVASQMSSALYDEQRVTISNKEKHFEPRFFQTTIRNLVFDGYMKLYDAEPNEKLMLVQKGQEIKLQKLVSTENFQYNNSHYSEASLIKKMESLGIGRPSTYVSTLNVILDRKYVEVKDIEGVEMKVVEYSIKSLGKVDEKIKSVKVGYEKKKLVPTEIGIKVDHYLSDNFSDIINVEFTAKMEESLDKIAEGSGEMQKTLSDFYVNFIKLLRKSKPLQITKGLLGVDSEGNEYAIMKAKYGMVLRKRYVKEDVVQFFPIDKDDVTLEHAIDMTRTSKLLGVYRKKPIFSILGKYGLYLKYGDKNIALKDGEVTFEEAKKLILK